MNVLKKTWKKLLAALASIVFFVFFLTEHAANVTTIYESDWFTKFFNQVEEKNIDSKVNKNKPSVQRKSDKKTVVNIPKKHWAVLVTPLLSKKVLDFQISNAVLEERLTEFSSLEIISNSSGNNQFRNRSKAITLAKSNGANLLLIPKVEAFIKEKGSVTEYGLNVDIVSVEWAIKYEIISTLTGKSIFYKVVRSSTILEDNKDALSDGKIVSIVFNESVEKLFKLEKFNNIFENPPKLDSI